MAADSLLRRKVPYHDFIWRFGSSTKEVKKRREENKCLHLVPNVHLKHKTLMSFKELAEEESGDPERRKKTGWEERWRTAAFHRSLRRIEKSDFS